MEEKVTENVKTNKQTNKQTNLVLYIRREVFM